MCSVLCALTLCVCCIGGMQHDRSMHQETNVADVQGSGRLGFRECGGATVGPVLPSAQTDALLPSTLSPSPHTNPHTQVTWKNQYSGHSTSQAKERGTAGCSIQVAA